MTHRHLPKEEEQGSPERAGSGLAELEDQQDARQIMADAFRLSKAGDNAPYPGNTGPEGIGMGHRG